jgi:hypothetical protein
MASSSSEIPPGADVPEANAAEERARRVNELKDRFTTPMQQIIAFRKSHSMDRGAKAFSAQNFEDAIE